MKFVAFRAEHALNLDLRPEQMLDLAGSIDKLWEIERAPGVAQTCMVDGEPVACGGVHTIWNKRALVWGFFADKWWRKASPKRVLRQCQEVLTRYPANRFEATVLPEFQEGILWLERLGFRCEAPLMRRYAPDGRDMALFARIRDDRT